VFRSPEAIARDVNQIGRFSRGPIFILGDLCAPGEDYANKVLQLFQENKVKNQLIMEIFSPTSRDMLQRMSQASPNFCLEISPESHDPEIRKILGRNYSTQVLEQTLSDALDVGCGRLDVFFMTGLPKQTPQSVMDTVDYCGYLMEKFRGDKRLSLFIAPISPFLDPGSLGFEQPDRYGYRVLFRTLEEHRQALLSPSWKYSLNYETEWKEKSQIVSEQMAEIGVRRIAAAREMMHRIENLLAKGNKDELIRLKPEIDRINSFPVSEKIQLELPVGLVKIRFWNSFWSWVTGR
jgi:radical SAM superfamily enzyme YgiQ (UPF0313 family)